jgi:hypothetical protein
MNAAARPLARSLAGLCLAALAVLAFWDVPRTGPTTSDDLVYEQAVLEGRITAFSAELAAGSGRFHHYLHVGLTALAGRIDSLPLRKTIALAGFLGVIAALAVLAAGLARSPELGLLTATLAVGLYQDNWHHNILTAYPFVFDSGMLWLLGAGYALVRHGRSGRAGWLVAANIAMFLAFCHFEAFVAYLPVLAGLVWLTGRGTARQRLMTLPAAFAVLPVYAAVYLGYRFAHPSQYAGNALALSSPEVLLKTVWAYSRAALPLGGFAFNIEYINRFPQATGRFVLGFGQYLAELAGHLAQFPPAWPAMGLLAGGLAFSCLDRAALARPRVLVWALCAYAVVCPNLLIALSAKYQEPAAGGLGWYVTSTFSFYAVAVGLALGGLALAGRLPALPRRVAAAVFGLAVGLAVLVNASVNASVRASKIAAGARWRLAALAAASPALAAVPDGARLVSPDLYAAINTELPGPDYWTAYFSHRTGRTFTVTAGLDGIDPTTSPVYFLRRLSGLLDADTALVLARVTGLGPVPADPYAAAPDTPTLLADRASVVMDASNRFCDVLYRDAAGWQVRPATAGGGRLSLTELAGSGLVPASLALLPARQLETGETSPLTLRFGQGFSAPERSVTGDVVWAGDRAELALANAGQTPVRLRLTATVVAFAPVALRIEGAMLPAETVLPCSGLTTPLSVEFDLPPGHHSLTLRALPATGGEKRFGLLDAQLVPAAARP